jgi:hypothetical protein
VSVDVPIAQLDSSASPGRRQFAAGWNRHLAAARVEFNTHLEGAHAARVNNPFRFPHLTPSGFDTI